MKKWIIKWQTGYGEMVDIIEATDQAKAVEEAYRNALEDFENSVDYSAEPYSKEEAENYGLE